MKQDDNGGVERKHLGAALSPIACGIARRLEWKLIPKLGQHPAMSEAEIKALENDKDTIDTIQHTRRVIQIWEAAGDLLKDPGIEVSGRLTLKQHNGQRVVAWKGVAKIRKQFQVPTLLLDATLPPLPLLQIYHPQVEMVADIKAAMPAHTRIRQVIGAPTSSNKLDDEQHLDSMRRIILQRWIETGRRPTLVICQQKVEDALRRCGLPANITLAHYNNIAGRDDFKTVRLAMLIGRTAPGPRAMEALAAALSGRQPIEATAPAGRLRLVRAGQARHPAARWARDQDVRGPASRSVRRDDPLAGPRGRADAGARARAGGQPRRRDAARHRAAVRHLPADHGRRGGAVAAAEPAVCDGGRGVMLTAPVDMVRLWPELWPNEKAAYRTIQQGVPALPGFEQVAYQLKGPKMKRRLGALRPGADPRSARMADGTFGSAGVRGPLRALSECSGTLGQSPYRNPLWNLSECSRLHLISPARRRGFKGFVLLDLGASQVFPGSIGGIRTPFRCDCPIKVVGAIIRSFGFIEVFVLSEGQLW